MVRISLWAVGFSNHALDFNSASRGKFTTGERRNKVLLWLAVLNQYSDSSCSWYWSTANKTLIFSNLLTMNFYRNLFFPDHNLYLKSLRPQNNNFNMCWAPGAHAPTRHSKIQQTRRGQDFFPGLASALQQRFGRWDGSAYWKDSGFRIYHLIRKWNSKGKIKWYVQFIQWN